MEPDGRMDGAAGCILVVEDDPGICEVLDVALSQAGYRVRCAESIDEALRAIAAEAPMAALIDFILPKAALTSLDLAARLYARGIPVVMMTGVLGAAERLADLPYQCLAKPFRLVELLAIVSDAARARIEPARRAATRPRP
jgi:DNA-binding NtrC family response regulator